MAHRAITEHQSHYLITLGHALINITARALALESDLRLVLLDVVGSGFAVGGTDRRDFLSINQEAARALRKVARRAAKPAFQKLADPVSLLAINADWQKMMESRGEHFHRLRAQSHGITGLSAQLPWTFGEGFRSIDVGMPPIYSETQGLAEELTRVNQKALGLVAGAMRQLFISLNEVHNELGA